MTKQYTHGRDIGMFFLVGLCQVSAAWVMAAWQAVYPPIPMFLAAVLAGALYRGRPRAAAWYGIIAGVGLGWLAEVAYVFTRFRLPDSGWQAMQPGEGLALGAAEMVLYAALLGFFAAFISWGGARYKSQDVRPAEAPEDELQQAVPFNPAPKTAGNLTQIPKDKKARN
jgi:hypothetical protein